MSSGFLSCYMDLLHEQEDADKQEYLRGKTDRFEIIFLFIKNPTLEKPI